MGAYHDNNRDSWFSSFYYTDWTGKKKKKLKRGFPTKESALKYEREFLEKCGKKSSMKFGGLVKLYLEDMKERVKPGTFTNKNSIIYGKILPYFENMNVDRITPGDIRRWQQDIMKRGFADTYLRTIHAQLSAIFNYAVRYYDLPRNPCVQAGSMGKGYASEMEIWTVEEFDLFQTAMKNRPVSGLAFSILFWTGMRIGEMLALTVADVNIANCTIRINKSLTHIHGYDIISEPKTPRSRRMILIPAELAAELGRYIAETPDMTPDTRLIPLSKNLLDREIHRGARKAGIKDIHVHCLRHSHTALIAALGASPVEAAERLGHENVQTTLNIYSHVLPGRQKAISDELGRLYRKTQHPEAE